MANSNSLEILKIKTVGYLDKAYDALLPWHSARKENNARSSLGFYGLLAGMVLNMGLAMSGSNQLEEDVNAATGSDYVQQFTNSAFRVSLPAECGRGDYYISSVDGDYGFYKAKDSSAIAMTPGDQFAAASKIDSCLNMIVEEAELGNTDLAEGFKIANDVRLSDPVHITYENGQTHSVLMGAANVDSVSLESYAKSTEDYVNEVKLLNYVWDEAVYDDLSPKTLKTFINQQGQGVAADTQGLQAVTHTKYSDLTTLGICAGTLLGLGLAFSMGAGHSATYRGRRKERQDKIATLQM